MTVVVVVGEMVVVVVVVVVGETVVEGVEVVEVVDVVVGWHGLVAVVAGDVTVVEGFDRGSAVVVGRGAVVVLPTAPAARSAAKPVGVSGAAVVGAMVTTVVVTRSDATLLEGIPGAPGSAVALSA